ncbi:hypothetical protein [Glycomyces tarimensis]
MSEDLAADIGGFDVSASLMSRAGVTEAHLASEWCFESIGPRWNTRPTLMTFRRQEALLRAVSGTCPEGIPAERLSPGAIEPFASGSAGSSG